MSDGAVRHNGGRYSASCSHRSDLLAIRTARRNRRKTDRPRRRAATRRCHRRIHVLKSRECVHSCPSLLLPCAPAAPLSLPLSPSIHWITGSMPFSSYPTFSEVPNVPHRVSCGPPPWKIYRPIFTLIHHTVQIRYLFRFSATESGGISHGHGTSWHPNQISERVWTPVIPCPHYGYAYMEAGDRDGHGSSLSSRWTGLDGRAGTRGQPACPVCHSRRWRTGPHGHRRADVELLILSLTAARDWLPLSGARRRRTSECTLCTAVIWTATTA